MFLVFAGRYDGNYKILPITEEYIEGFRKAVGSVAREWKYLAFLDEPAFEMAHAFVLENLRENWPHFIAVCEDEVIGWCDISSLHRPVYAHSGLLGIGVLASYRGKGIGEALMRAAISKAYSKRSRRIELAVNESNKPAIALYKKLGFEIEGLHRNAVKIEEHYENSITMVLLF